MVVEKVWDTIKKYNLIHEGDNVIVGLSGGPDSACLLHVLHSLREKLAIGLYALHVNHQLRGQESDADEVYVRELCARLEVELHVKSISITQFAHKNGLSLEEAGREVRYREFESLAHQLGEAKIAVAHNKNDQAETVLMRILRGTGIDGLKGMSHQRGAVIRPLLDVERNEIEQYCSDEGLSPRTDSSNLESIYTRNRIRLELIPTINRLFETDIVESLYKMATVMQDDCEIIEDSTSQALEQCRSESLPNELVLRAEELQKMRNGLIKRVVRSAVMQVKGDLKGIENKHIESIVTLVFKGRTGAVVQLPQGLRAALSYGRLRIYEEPVEAEVLQYEHGLEIPGSTFLKELGARIDVSVVSNNEFDKKYLLTKNSSLEQFFDYDGLKEGIHIRNRKNGDIFKPFRSAGTKKLKEYFIDNKIPRDERDKIPLVAKNNEIVWVIGHKISDKFKVTENTKTVARVKYVPLAQNMDGEPIP